MYRSAFIDNAGTGAPRLSRALLDPTGSSEPPNGKLTVQGRCGTLLAVHRIILAAACLSLAICYAQDGSLATFGTTVVIPGGLTGKIYHIPASSMGLPKFEKLESVGTVYAKGLYIPPRDFTDGFPGITDRIEWFALDFTGRFYVNNPGRYRFSLCSDDGSKLYLDGKAAIDNDGTHPTICKEGSIQLSGGIHAIRLSYFQGPRYHLSLMLAVAGPADKAFRPFNTDEFKAPANPDDWKYGSPDALTLPPAPDAGRTSLNDVIRRENPTVSISVQVLAHDQPVRGLKQSDFIIRDEGESQNITAFRFQTQPLDVLLLVDASPDMRPYIERVKAVAARAISRLNPNDRIGIVLFHEKSLLTLDLALNRDMAMAAISKIVTTPGGAKDLNSAVEITAHYLLEHARQESTSAIVILSDNGGTRGVSDRVTRDALWHSNVILSGLLAPGGDPQESDVRPFIEATGGEALPADDRNVPLAEALQSLHERYRITWRAPGGIPKTIRRISVELTAEAKTRLGGASIRATGAYVVPE